jgi:phosphoglucomutase/phosphopentomutase
MGSTDMSAVKELTEKWLLWDENKTTKEEVAQLKSNNEWDKLGKIMLKRLEFGTAGIRGRMGPGFGQMNDLVIIQVTQGLKNYLLKQQKDIKSKGVVYGYDGRHNSERWAKLAAGVFMRENIPVYLFKTTTPTPFIPFAIRQLGLSAGVMVTASHNPKWDNGYKVYWDNGSQILSPHDKEIQKEILNSLEPASGAFQEPEEPSPLLSDPMSLVNDPYFKVVQDKVYSLEMNQKLNIPIVYTAMHGVGYPYVYQSWIKSGFQADLLHSVKEQENPDPEFSTVDFPNPEEGATALDLSFKTANELGARYILANDPDADRLGVAQRIGDRWKILSGNEIGGLLGWWHLKIFQEKNPDVLPGDIYMLASTVSSKILNTLTKKIGANFIETLTGFKHMGNVAHKLIGEKKHVLFAFEEAIGFMCGSAVLDKDGVSAVAKIGELIAYLEEKNLTLADQLNAIYLEYGYHYTLNSYYLCYDPELTDKIFNRIRSFKNQPDTYPDSLGGVAVKNIRDLTTGYDSSTPDKKATLPTSKSSHMITFQLENGIVITLRTSGTEPKIKYYTEYCAKPGVPQSDWKDLEAELSRIVEDTIQTLLQPQINNIKPKPE